MKIDGLNKEEFLKRKKLLETTNKKLKKEFIGLDKIIDNVVDLIEPWFLFPEAQIRPTIINLWGMTGVGKTSLVTKLFDLLGVNGLYKFDIGDFTSENKGSTLKYKISDGIAKLKDDDRFILVFDEFQLGRTMTSCGAEIDRSSLRVLWDLFDSGKFEIVGSNYNAMRLFVLDAKLEECINNGVIATNGIVTGNPEFHAKMFGIDLDKKTKKSNKEVVYEDSVTESNAPDEESEPHYFIPTYFDWVVQSVWEKRFLSTSDVRTFLNDMDEDVAHKFIIDSMDEISKPEEYDFSKCVIFNIGNLDEAYKVSNDINPDSDADFLYEFSKKITLPQIKKALLKRFRPEQLSRLGNNHIIYPAFSSDGYKQLIELELERFKNRMIDRFDLKVEFHQSVYDILYKEGVFPTQGTRPVFSTIVSLIESNVGKIITEIIQKNKLEVETLSWSYGKEKHNIKFLDKDNEVCFTKRIKVDLKTDNLRQSTSDDDQALVAIHEAGHVVCGVMALHLLPKHVVSKTADSDAGGFCLLELPEFRSKSVMLKDVVFTLGGYAAEKLIFGEENLTTGSYSDLNSATNLLLSYIKGYGMAGVPLIFSNPDFRIQYEKVDESVIGANELALQLANDCLAEATEFLKRDKVLLIKLAEYLSENPRMDSELIREYVEKFSVDPIHFKEKETYYNFKSKLKNMLDEHKKVKVNVEAVCVNQKKKEK